MSKEIILYRERQRFRQFWLWVIILGAAAIFWAGFVSQVMMGHTFGSRPVSSVQLVVLVILFAVGLPYFFYRMSLTTEVLPGELRVRFWPFHLRPVKIPLHSIREYERLTYNPILDYGGWGIRWGLKGKAYNVSGNKGVKLYFYNHKPLLIGSQRPEELYQAIERGKQLKQP